MMEAVLTISVAFALAYILSAGFEDFEGLGWRDLAVFGFLGMLVMGLAVLALCL